MSRLNSWHPPRPDGHAVYLRHPDTARILCLYERPDTARFIAVLKLDGYQSASAEDYAAQQQRKAGKP